jgi:hypothetical protein
MRLNNEVRGSVAASWHIQWNRQCYDTHAWYNATLNLTADPARLARFLSSYRGLGTSKLSDNYM